MTNKEGLQMTLEKNRKCFRPDLPLEEGERLFITSYILISSAVQSRLYCSPIAYSINDFYQQEYEQLTSRFSQKRYSPESKNHCPNTSNGNRQLSYDYQEVYANHPFEKLCLGLIMQLSSSLSHFILSHLHNDIDCAYKW